MARKDKHIVIFAKRDSDKPNGVDFHMESANGCKLESIVFNKYNEQMYPGDEHEVHFKLVQEKGMTLQFAQDPDDALWVAWGDQTHIPECPKTRPPNTPDPIFHAEHSAPNHLRAVNTNVEKLFFSFSINFVDRTATGPGVHLIPYDPIGENQNSGINRWDSFSDFATAPSTMLAISLALVIAVGYQYFA
jgi:hypothetical protein